MKLRIVSPHRDDAAFSLAISIRHWLERGHDVEIVNVFTRSLYAPYAEVEGFSQSDRLAHVSRLRNKEDKSFLEAIPGATMFDLNLVDAPMRLNCDSSQVCAMNVSASDDAIPAIYEGLKALLHQQDAALVLPLALGRHVDHLTARDAALPLVPYLPCAFYEDLPYALRQGAQNDLSELRHRLVAELQTPLSPVLCYDGERDPVGFKRATALLYASQISPQEAEPIATFALRYGGGERLWANNHWLALAETSSLSATQIDPEGYPLPA